MQVLESVIEHKCRQIAEKHKCILLKIEKRRGWPDRLLLAPNGKSMFIEFKKLGEEPMPFQLYIHQQLRQMNHTVAVVDTYLKFMEALQLLKASDQ